MLHKEFLKNAKPFKNKCKEVIKNLNGIYVRENSSYVYDNFRTLPTINIGKRKIIFGDTAKYISLKELCVLLKKEFKNNKISSRYVIKPTREGETPRGYFVLYPESSAATLPTRKWADLSSKERRELSESTS